jgi:superfamily II DNA or RNA helicase
MLTNFFAVDTAHADALAAEVNRQLGDGTCLAIHSHISDAHARIEAFRAGEFRVAASVMMVAEGFDYPALRCGVLARPTKSERLLVQMLGRLLRLHDSKPWALLMDCQGAYEKLDLASIYDVSRHDDAEDERAVTEAAASYEEDDEGVPMLSEVISRLRDIDLFRRRCREARSLPWVRVDDRMALPLDRAWIVVGPSKYEADKAAIAVLSYQRHRPVCQALEKAIDEPDAFRVAERWARKKAHPVCWETAVPIEVKRKILRWFNDRGPPTAGEIGRLAKAGIVGDAVPRTHGEARAIVRGLYAQGAF